MINTQLYLKTHSLEDLEEEFGIKARRYDDRVVLKYSITTGQKTHPVVRECRGLILSIPDYEIVSRPFDRFFNYGEAPEEVSDFSWDKSEIYEKLDGSLIQVYNYKGEWYCGTSGTAFAEGTTPLGDKTYKELFEEAIDGKVEDTFKEFNKNFTYLFELVSPENRIVTPYSETKTYLLAIRYKETGDYYPLIDFLTQMKRNNNYFCYAPKTYKFNDPKQIKEFVESLPQLEEWVVCYDPLTQKRIKMKGSSYVALHHLRGNEVTKKSILTLLLKNEMDEYLTYFPEDKKFMTTYIEAYDGMLDSIFQFYETVKEVEDQKEFALKVKDSKYSAVFFQLRKGMKLGDIFNLDNINYILRIME